MSERLACQRRSTGGLDVLAWPGLEAEGIDVIVPERGGGVSTGPYASLNLGLHVGDDAEAVHENRRRAAAALGAGLDDLVFCNQTHGRVVVAVGATDRGRGATSQDDAIPGADAMVTTTPGVVLTVLVADCVPIVLVDPGARVLACVHAGWRGTVAGVATAAVDAMVAHGARADDVVALLGPAVPPERYQVGPEVAAAAERAFGDDVGAVLRADAEPDRWRFDLWAANERLLVGAGVRAANVSRSGAVPTGDDRFFSDRAERPCGRFAALARLRA